MSNISEPFDIRQFANEILGTALPPTPKQRGERALNVLADEPAEIECVADKVLADIEAQDPERWDGMG